MWLCVTLSRAASILSCSARAISIVSIRTVYVTQRSQSSPLGRHLYDQMDLHTSKRSCTVVDMTYAEHVAKLVKNSVEASPYSIKYVAEESLVPRTTLTRKMNGAGEFSVAEIYRVAKVLGIPVTDLVPDDEEAEQAA